MSRKDYEAVAKILRETVEQSRSEDWIHPRTLGYAICVATDKLCDLFANENPRFDSDRFQNAVWGWGR